jgi:hypothetical protein
MRSLFLCVLWMLSFAVSAQKVAQSPEQVKKPKNGKFYFFENENRLTIHVNDQYFTLFQAPNLVKPQEPNPSDPKPDDPTPQPTLKETVIGYWDSPDRVLALYPIKNKYYLIQKAVDGSYYIPRGINLLADYRTVKTVDLPVNSPIEEELTGLGGLMPPSSFPELDFLKLTGRVKNKNGEFVFPSSVPEPEPEPGQEPGQGGGNPEPQFGVLQGIPKYPLPTRDDWTNFEDFPNFNLPEGITTIGGYGFPLYANEGLVGGKLASLSKGYSNLVNVHATPRSKWEGKNTYGFNQLQYLIKVAARSMISSGKNGGEYGDIAIIANLPNDQFYIPYQNVTIKGAIELGVHLWYTNCCGNSIDNQSWDILQNEGVLMIDEESMTPLSWKGGDHYSFMGYLNQGLIQGAGNKYRVLWYAQPVQRWFQNTVIHGIDRWTKQDIEASFTDIHNMLSSPGWKNSTWYVDANGAYSKVPFLSKTDIYQKQGNKFLTDSNGKRLFRKDNFSVEIYGKQVPVFSEPHEWIKYSIQNGKTGEMHFGAQYFDITTTGAIVKKQWRDQGYNLPANGLARPNPNSWEGEAKMWVDGIYRRADGIMSDLLYLARLERGNYDISKANTKYKLYGEQRPKTEPWTFGGNSIEAREVGESQIFYDTYMLLYSGGLTASTWDDGFYRSELPQKGSPLYDGSDYWGRYHSKLAAIQSALRPLEGTKVTDWTYVHFYYPYWGHKNSEVISSGIYYKGKLHLFFLNPTLENGERQTLTLKAKGKSVQFDLVGHEFYTYTLDAGEGLTPQDFKLSYTTIYGRKVNVNGKVTNKIDDHYE